MAGKIDKLFPNHAFETYSTGGGSGAALAQTNRGRGGGDQNMTRVLVVDDDPDLVAICSLVLASEGYAVDSARNGSEAVHKLQSQDVDLVLLDVMMPVLDGLSVCKMVKRDPRTKDLPVVLISASSILREKGKGLADAVIEKPFDLDDLVNTVSHFAPPT